MRSYSMSRKGGYDKDRNGVQSVSGELDMYVRDKEAHLGAV